MHAGVQQPQYIIHADLLYAAFAIVALVPVGLGAKEAKDFLVHMIESCGY